jgi:hypothetical protein
MPDDFHVSGKATEGVRILLEIKKRSVREILLDDYVRPALPWPHTL